MPHRRTPSMQHSTARCNVVFAARSQLPHRHAAPTRHSRDSSDPRGAPPLQPEGHRVPRAVGPPVVHAALSSMRRRPEPSACAMVCAPLWLPHPIALAHQSSVGTLGTHGACPHLSTSDYRTRLSSLVLTALLALVGAALIHLCRNRARYAASARQASSNRLRHPSAALPCAPSGSAVRLR